MDGSLSTHVNKEIYYYVGDRRIKLFPDQRVFVVQLVQDAYVKSQVLSPRVHQILDEAEVVTFLPRDRLNIYRAESGLKFVEELHQASGVALALPAFNRTAQGGDQVLVTSRLLAQFRPDVSPDKITVVLERLALRILEPLPYASPNGFLLEAVPGIDGLGALTAANALVEEGLVVFAEPDLIQSRHWRDTQPDPTAAAFLDQQWHLRVTGVLDAWKNTQGSPSIRIAVLDDGFDMGHVEFSVAVVSGQPKVAAQFDFATGREDASPKTYADSHGTPAAGVAAAAGVKAAGVAPGCRLIVARLPNLMGVSEEAQMFQWAADSGADVISCSWGPVDGTGETVPLPTPTRLAIRYCLNNGRAGKGIPIFWASGNGSESVSADGYASNPDVMAIAACTAAEEPAIYSDFGPEIFACAPSNGSYGQPAIFTTDRRGSSGYNPGNVLCGDAMGDYTNSFGGTSAAAPLAAGVGALVLSANPKLSVTQVRSLLRQTADRIGSTASYDGSGHSDQLGYGRLNAAKAVAAARQTAPAGVDGPTILGPPSWSRVDRPPVFQVDPNPHPYYVVEVTSNYELFDGVKHGNKRSADNFYGSWSDSPFQIAPTYTLPAVVWLRLRLADRLWYRVGASASPTQYINYIVTTPDNQGNLAPSISLLSGVGAPPPLPEVERLTISKLARQAPNRSGRSLIEGPLRWTRRLGPPTFWLERHPTLAYRVEVATDTKHFDLAKYPGMLINDTFFTSDWVKPGSEISTPQIGFHAYTLSLETWEALGNTQRLYYRLITESSANLNWPDYPVTTLHSQAEDTRYIEVVDG